MARIQGLAELFLTGGDQLVKTGAGEVHQIVVSYNSAIGSSIVFRDGLTAAAPALFAVVFSTANGSHAINFPQGKRFETGLFVDFQSAGQAQCALTYK